MKSSIANRIAQIELQRERELFARRQRASRHTSFERAAALTRILSSPPETAGHARIHALLGRAAARRERDVQDLI